MLAVLAADPWAWAAAISRRARFLHEALVGGPGRGIPDLPLNAYPVRRDQVIVRRGRIRVNERGASFINGSLMVTYPKFTAFRQNIADHAGMKRVRGDTSPKTAGANAAWRQLGIGTIGLIAIVWLGLLAVGS